MRDKDFAVLLSSIKEAGDIKHGTKKPNRTFDINTPEIKSIRRTLNVSQSEFAMMIGVSIKTLQNWEQGRRIPKGPAKALLRVASRNPQAILEALHVI